MKKLTFLFFFLFCAQNVQAWTVDGNTYTKRKTITIQHANVDSTLTDFPLYVQFTGDTDIGAVAQADGDDIRFESSGNVLLNAEKEYFEISGGAASGYFWVKVPSVSTGAGTDIYMYYGDGSASAQSGATSVWDSNFTLVSHLSGSNYYFADSTANADHAYRYGLQDEYDTNPWTGANHGTHGVSGGTYQFTITNTSDPWASRDVADFHPGFAVIEMRVKSYTNGPTGLEFFYTDNADCSGFSGTCEQTFASAFAADGAWHEITLTMTDAEWTDADGNIDDLRLDFVGQTATGTFEVDYLRFKSTTRPTLISTELYQGPDYNLVEESNFTGSTQTTNTFTFSAIVKPSATHEIDAESTSATTGVSGQRYAVAAPNQGTDAGAGISVGTNGISVYEHGSAYLSPLAVYSASIGTGESYVHVVYNSKQPTIYVNGASARVGLTSTKTNVYSPFELNSEPSWGRFNDPIDEFRVSNIARSAAWIKFESANALETDNELTFGSEETDGGAPAATVPKQAIIF